MRLLFLFVILFSFSVGFVKAQKTSLSADEFESRLRTGNVQLVDVRTVEEFEKGYIEGASNYDVSSSEYSSKVRTLKKDQPVLVYCLSGGRSSKAAAQLRKDGYTVFELKGGLLEWKSKKKRVTKPGGGAGMSASMFKEHLVTPKLVLVDFYAKWCAPCKVMAPDIQALKDQYKENIVVLKIDADANSILVDSLNVDALPTLKLFKNGVEVWSRTGLTKKNAIEKQILAHR